jgi:hypothetical protein
MIECFLEDRLIVSIRYVLLHTEFDSIYEARQMILFISLYHHLQETYQIIVKVSAQDSKTSLHYANWELNNLIEVHKLGYEVTDENPNFLEERHVWIRFSLT